MPIRAILKPDFRLDQTVRQQLEDEGFVFDMTPEEAADFGLAGEAAQAVECCFRSDKPGDSTHTFNRLATICGQHCRLFVEESQGPPPIFDEDLATGKKAGWADRIARRGDRLFKIALTTPDLSFHQTFMGDTNQGGTGTWKVGRIRTDAKGAGVRVAVIEQGILADHEDIPSGLQGIIGGPIPTNGYPDHGTAVMGVPAANVPNNLGMTGAVPEIKFYPIVHNHIGLGRALTESQKILRPGDFCVIEAQLSPPPQYSYGPTDYVPVTVYSTYREAIKRLTDAGIIVVLAAGNGAVDLADPIFNGIFLQDLNHIIVGAGSPDARHEKLAFSNFFGQANRVRNLLQGWGDNVATLGYGALYQVPGFPQYSYTDRFNGTSSATPVATIVPVGVQSAVIAAGQAVLGPSAMIDLIQATGIKEIAYFKIGTFPDLAAALQRVLPIADYDHSGRVDFKDFVTFARHYGNNEPEADLNHDGRVGYLDFVLFASQFGLPTFATGVDAVASKVGLGKPLAAHYAKRMAAAMITAETKRVAKVSP